MPIRLLAVALLASVISAPVLAVQAVGQVSGTVYLERDGQGGRGPMEPGLPGVVVSDGTDIVHTDAQGRYRIAARPGQVVFVVKPDGYRFGASADGLPAFWHRVPATGTDAADVDFGLSPEAWPAATGHMRKATGVLLFTDSQVKSTVDIDHYRRDIVEPIVGRHAAAFGTTLGDLVDDEMDLYPALNAVTTLLGVPWFHVPGNHDVDPGASACWCWACTSRCSTPAAARPSAPPTARACSRCCASVRVCCC